MKLALLILGLISLSLQTTDDASELGVVQLKEGDFSQFINDNAYVQVLFYAPWCNYCKSLFPEFEKAAISLKGEVEFVKVDATEEENLSNEWNITGFPTMKLFRNGKYYSDYLGERKAEDIVEWTRRLSGPSSVLISSSEDLAKVLETKDFVSHVVFFPTSETDENLNIYKSVSDNTKFVDVGFYHSFDKSLGESIGVDVVGVFINGKLENTYTGEFSDSKFEEWASKSAFPLVNTLNLNSEFYSKTIMEGRPLFVSINEESADSTLESQSEFFYNVATTNPDMNIHYLETTTKDYSDLAKEWGASGTKFPTYILVTFTDDSRALIRAIDERIEYTVDNVASWLKNCVETDKCPTHIRSENIEDLPNEPSKNVVGNNFEEVAFDESKDVFIKFYSPTCPHCVRIRDVWEDLAEAYENIDSVVVAKIDAVANSIPEQVEITSFPSFLLFKAGDKANPVYYEGGRNVKDFSKFIIENASLKFNEADVVVKEVVEEVKKEEPVEEIDEEAQRRIREIIDKKIKEEMNKIAEEEKEQTEKVEEDNPQKEETVKDEL